MWEARGRENEGSVHFCHVLYLLGHLKMAVLAPWSAHWGIVAKHNHKQRHDNVKKVRTVRSKKARPTKETNKKARTIKNELPRCRSNSISSPPKKTGAESCTHRRGSNPGRCGGVSCSRVAGVTCPVPDWVWAFSLSRPSWKEALHFASFVLRRRTFSELFSRATRICAVETPGQTNRAVYCWGRQEYQRNHEKYPSFVCACFTVGNRWGNAIALKFYEGWRRQQSA